MIRLFRKGITPIDEDDKWKNFGFQSPLIPPFKEFPSINEPLQASISFKSEELCAEALV